MHFLVVVLGDVGRSPRMQYHCHSLLDAGHNVTFIGYAGEAFEPGSPRCNVIRFNDPVVPEWVPSFLYFVVRLGLLVMALTSVFWEYCFDTHRVDFVLVQNPPAMPTLAMAYLFCHVKGFYQRRRPGFIIDWHNLGHSMLRNGSLAQRGVQLCEEFFGRRADGHLTVTQAMKEYLASSVGITNNIQVLYDQPPDMFAPLNVEEQHAIFTELHDQLCSACPPSWLSSSTLPNQTMFTENVAGKIRPRAGRPALITSSTSWTPDEDFGILFDALQLLDDRLSQASSEDSSKVLVIVTGKGPQRAMYEQRIDQHHWTHVAVATLWLPSAMYPRLLACADLGISLHTSTSGLDLPMKILDLFGCQIPVVAYHYPTCRELVQENVNGRTFRTQEELCTVLEEVLAPLFAAKTASLGNHAYGVLETYSQNLEGRTRWGTNWTEHALPVILRSTPM